MHQAARRVLISVVVAVSSLGCASEAEPEDSSSSESHAAACGLLVSAEPSDIPDAAEYQGLHGSLLYLLTRAGPLIRADGLVYLKATSADRLDELAAELEELDGVAVVVVWDQDDSYVDFERRFGDTGAEPVSVSPEILPAMVAIDLDSSEASSTVADFRDRPEIEAVNLQAETEGTFRTWLRIVVRQYENELEQLEGSEPERVSSAARELLRLDRDEDAPAEFMYRLSDTTEQLVRFELDNC
jgi:FtsX extracellular domain